jgi:DNA-directed RNA polymerase subunit E'/Rpb7
MEQLAVFEEMITLTPLDLHNEIENMDTLLLAKLQKQLEGRCSQHGYVIPNTLQLLSRSMGTLEKGRFTGDFLFYLKAQGKVYNPPDGTLVEGEVIRKNKMGLYVIVENAIRIMIPRDLHIGNAAFDSVELGSRIQIEIKKSRFQMNDTHILSVGQFLSVVGSGGAATVPGGGAATVPGGGAATASSEPESSAAATAEPTGAEDQEEIEEEEEEEETEVA